MKEITIKLKGRDSWISVILGIYGALGAFISLSHTGLYGPAIQPNL